MHPASVKFHVLNSVPRYIVKVTVTGKGMMPDSKAETGIWIRNYEEASTAPTAPIKVTFGRYFWCGNDKSCLTIRGPGVQR